MYQPIRLLTAAALAAGAVLGALHPAAANPPPPARTGAAVAGYTAGGDTVYRDGRVVTPNGSSFYPRNQRQSVACQNGSCAIYDNDRGYDGHRPGWRGDQRPAPPRDREPRS